MMEQIMPKKSRRPQTIELYNILIWWKEAEVMGDIFKAQRIE